MPKRRKEVKKKRKKHPAIGRSMQQQKKIHRAMQKKQAGEIRNRVTIKVFQKGGRIIATVDPVTGKVLKREKNPRYVPKDKEFKRLLKKKKAQQSKG